MPPADRRKFKRLETGWVTRIHSAQLTQSVVTRLERIKDVSRDGVFIETQWPYEVGTIVSFSFEVPGTKKTLHARGIVRWANDGKRHPGRPAGMGIEFVDVSTEMRDAITHYLEGETEGETIRILLKSKLHEQLLRFYCRKIGETFPVDLLAQFLACRHGDIVECLNDFERFKIVRLAGTNVLFVPAENPELARAIQSWYEGLDHGLTPRGGFPAVKP